MNRPSALNRLMVLFKNGLVDQYEVMSKTDLYSKLWDRMVQNQAILGEKAGEIHILTP